MLGKGTHAFSAMLLSMARTCRMNIAVTFLFFFRGRIGAKMMQVGLPNLGRSACTTDYGEIWNNCWLLPRRLYELFVASDDCHVNLVFVSAYSVLRTQSTSHVCLTGREHLCV